MPRDLVGSHLGPYLIEELIGRGGMGEVYLATHSRLERKVALKVLPAEFSDDEGFRGRFLRESRLAAQLDHPNIVPVYDADEAVGRLYIVMRYVRGSDLARLLEEESPLEVERGLTILKQVAAALDAAHAVGLVHRDVKPANVLVSDSGERCFLTDFGLTRMAGGGASTEYGTLVGTLEYVSPEQINGAELDARSDVYSFGCLAFEVLTGVRPFIRNNAAALLNDHLNTPPPKATDYRPELGPAVDDVLRHAMAKPPTKRYPSAGQFAETLERAVPPAPAPQAAPVAARAKKTRTLVGAGAVGLALVVAFLAARRPEANAPSRPSPSVTPATRPVGGIVAVGDETSCAATNTREVMCWASTPDGRPAERPSRVQGLSDVSMIAAGDAHACALKGDGSVWCWGDNKVGQLSRPADGNDVRAPVQIDVPTAKHLVAGRNHTCAIARVGTLHCWGWDHFGQSSGTKEANRILDGKDNDLDGEEQDINTFRAGPQVPGLGDVRQVALGNEFTCALLADGVRCWGLNFYGRVTAQSPSPAPATFRRYSDYAIFEPTAVKDLGQVHLIASSHGHVCAARPTEVVCWGGERGQTGKDGRLGTPDRPGFGKVDLSEQSSLHVGRTINCVIRAQTLTCWGATGSLLLKTGRRQDGLRVMPMINVVDASIGENYACVALIHGEVECWGSNVASRRVAGVVAATAGAATASPSST